MLREVALAVIDAVRRHETEMAETEDGLFETRRRLLWLTAATAVSLAMPRATAARPRSLASADGMLAWDAFLEACLPGALERHANATASGQDAYLYWIASMTARLDRSTIPKAKLAAFGGFDPLVETGPAYFGKPFFVIAWRMAPHAVLPPHTHPRISVCTLCTEGEARIRNFEVSGAAPDPASTKSFQVRATRDELLTPGRLSDLSAVRDNIHTLRAGPAGASGIDITTYHGKDEGFSFLDIVGKPRDPESQVYDAVWRKR